MGLASGVAVIGGADPDDPLDPQNKGRHIAVGALLVTVATWAFLASLLAFHSLLSGHAAQLVTWVMSAVFAALLASIVFHIDVLITVVPLKSDDFGSRLRLVLIRGLLSLGTGIIVSHATLLSIYGDDISKIVTETANKDTDRITTEVTA